MSTVIKIEPAAVDIEVERGTDNEFEFVITDGSGRAEDITADTVEWTVKTDFNGTLVFKKTSGPGDHTDPENGGVTFKVDKEDIDDEAYEKGITTWVHELRRIKSDEDESVHIKGEFRVFPSVGR